MGGGICNSVNNTNKEERKSALIQKSINDLRDSDDACCMEKEKRNEGEGTSSHGVEMG